MSEPDHTSTAPTQTAFQTRVARRVLLLFVVSAIVPVATLTVISYRQVADQLASQGRDRLQRAGKATGMAILQRLQLLDAELKRNAASITALRESSRPVSQRTGTLSQIFERMWVARDAVEPLAVVGNPGRVPPLNPEQQRRLQAGQSTLAIASDGPTRRVVIGVSMPDDGTGSATLWAEAKPAFLWGGGDLQAATPPGMDLCVLDDRARPLFCTLPLEPDALAAAHREVDQRDRVPFEWDAGERDLVVAGWPIFLKFMFGRPDWTVLLAEPESSILAAASDFRRAFPQVALLALLIVVFLSHSQIRRVLDPLRRLTAATKFVARRDFDRKVDVRTGDEFEDLGDAFNAMASQLGRQFRTLSAINDIDHAALSRSSPEEIVEVVLDRVPVATEAQLVGFALRTPENGREAAWRVSGRLPPSRRFAGDAPLQPDDMDRLLRLPREMVGAGEPTLPAFMAAIPADVREGLRFVVRPLAFEREPAGALIVGFASNAEIDDAVEVTDQVADQVSVAFGNTQLLERLEQLSRGTLQALARSIDAMSPWTAGHSERVRDLALAIGHEMGLDQKQLDCLGRGALLHDIGKLGVPSAVLNKRGQLTPEEYESVQRHVHTGARILAPIPSYADVIPIVLHHHEHYDGTGYPDGLSGQDIPLLARIAAFADCYDALSSQRPYRTGSHAQAIAVIRQEIGTSFDPTMAEAFFRAVEERRLDPAG